MTDFFSFARLNLHNVLIVKQFFFAESSSYCELIILLRKGTIVRYLEENKEMSEKQISQSFSYCELINLLRNGTIVRCLEENKELLDKSVFREA